MHVTLHTTTGCTMRCAYCYAPESERQDMSEATARAAVDFAARCNPHNAGIIFFGGEPLLRRDLIESTIAYCRELERAHAWAFHYKITTNGMLLDEDFLEFAARCGMCVAISCDGVREAHNMHRRTKDGRGTFDALMPKLELLLRHQPYANAYMTVTPETVQYYEESVRFLLDTGFRYVIASLNYAGNWTDAHVAELARQYRALAKLYEKLTDRQHKFYFSPFETRLASHIRGEDENCHRCALGLRQVSIAPDGAIYPCVQFVQDGVSNTQWALGHVQTGVDESKRMEIYLESRRRPAECGACALNGRCNNDCSCLNWQTTGVIHQVSPVLCETERVIFPIVDRLGNRLFRRRAPMFIQKHYNAAYPLLSLIDDMQPL